MDIFAVVPAVRSLDLRPLAGRSLARHALAHARAARKVAAIAMVTADPELAQTAEDEGIIAVAPPAEAGNAALLSAALDALGHREGLAPAVTVLLDPVFALRTSAMIDGAVDRLMHCGADSVIAVAPLQDPLWVQDEAGMARPLATGTGERCHIQTGVVEGVRTGVFEHTRELPTGRIVLYEVPAVAALRLDDGDWSGPEALLQRTSAARARALLRRAKLLVFDFDGVMTDNRVLVTEDGREAVLCNRSDGLGLDMLRAAGMPLAVISKEANPVVGARCRKLKIPCEQGIEDKLGVLRRIADEQGLSLADVAYMGNDVNDLACMAAAGVSIAPADAHPAALAAAAFVTTASGGSGAVREVCDRLLAARAESIDAGG